jgi:hypothetical protein
MLNTASAMFAMASIPQTVLTTATSRAAYQTSAKAAPSTRLTNGPMPTTTNSSLAVRAGDVDSVTPPSANSVMRRTPIPRDRLARVCPSSCSRMLPMNSTATKPAIPNTTGVPSSPWRSCNVGK